MNEVEQAKGVVEEVVQQFAIIQQFGSVLEIAFAVNFLFLIFDLRPVIYEGWASISLEFQPVFVELMYEAKDSDLSKDDRLELVMAYHKPEIAYLVLEILMIALTAIISLIALAWLINAGFNANFKIGKTDMIVFLCVAFIPLPIYYCISSQLMEWAKRKIKTAKDRIQERSQTKTEPPAVT